MSSSLDIFDKIMGKGELGNSSANTTNNTKNGEFDIVHFLFLEQQ